MNTPLQPLHWEGDAPTGALHLLDQTCLPAQEVWIRVRDTAQLRECIATLRVRGAPAIGLAGAYGVVLALRELHTAGMLTAQTFRSATECLAAVRPTAINLAWAVQRVADCGLSLVTDGSSALAATLREAQAIEAENAAACEQMAAYGAALMAPDEGVLTHCNAGPLATAGCGTALGVVLAAHARGLRPRVFADETRPLLQGARLTAFELQRAGISVTVLCDGAAAGLLASGRVQRVLVGADRIAANGDTANKVGTYAVALAAHAHGIPFHVVAPVSTFDLSLPDGKSVRIEERGGEEVLHVGGMRTAPQGVAAWNPAFDVTPAALITSIICERGVIAPVNAKILRSILGS